jgi:hypothetical protein
MQEAAAGLAFEKAQEYKESLSCWKTFRAVIGCQS